jgi:hypothetical protein
MTTRGTGRVYGLFAEINKRPTLQAFYLFRQIQSALMLFVKAETGKPDLWNKIWFTKQCNKNTLPFVEIPYHE